jgi:hypothetical protein
MKSNLIIIVTAAMILAACSSEENEVNNGPVAAKVTASIDGAMSRAVDQTWAANDAIGVMATSSSSSTSTINTLYKNVKYTVGGAGTAGTFTSTDGIFFQAAGQTVTFAAYYPYQTSADKATLPGTNGVVTGANTQSQSTAAAQSAFDYLYASGATASKSQPTLTFSGDYLFRHRMARLILVLKTSADDGLTAAQVNASTTTFKLGGLKHNGTFNVTDGTAEATGSEEADWNITSNVNNVYISGDGTRTYTMILYPQTVAAALPFSAIIDGQTFANTTAIQPALQAGYSYTYTITVKKTGMVISGCTIHAWNTGTSGSGDATMLDKN